MNTRQKNKKEREYAAIIAAIDRSLHCQRDIDEYRRFLGDLLIMLVKGEPQCVVKHSVSDDDDYMGWIWDKVHDLIKENKELKERVTELSA